MAVARVVDRTGSRWADFAHTCRPSLPSTVSSATSSITASAGSNATAWRTSTAAKVHMEYFADE
jgi:hypothetical protein